MKAFSGVQRFRLGRHADLGKVISEVTAYRLEETFGRPKDQRRMSWFCHPPAVAAVKPTQARPCGSVAIERSTTVSTTGAGEPSRKTESTGGWKRMRAVCTLPSFKRTLRSGEAARRGGGQRDTGGPPLARIPM